MKTLLIESETLQNWDVNEILTQRVKSKEQQISDMLEHEWDNTVSKCGMTYLEIEQFNNTYNNFR